MSPQEPDFHRFSAKKAYEIGYALFRVASAVREPALAAMMRKQAFMLLGSIAELRYPEAQNALRAIEYTARFSGDLNILHPNTAEIIAREVQGLHSAIAEYTDSAAENAAREMEKDVKNAFSAEKFESPKAQVKQKPRRARAKAKIERPKEEQVRIEEPRVLLPPVSFLADSKNSSRFRQAQILDRIRQTGNCRLKELQEFLPNVSERTIRYDLEELVNQGQIERIGGGPLTSYRLTLVTEPPIDLI